MGASFKNHDYGLSTSTGSRDVVSSLLFSTVCYWTINGQVLFLCLGLGVIIMMHDVLGLSIWMSERCPCQFC